ncbi:unnamed protein product, partial [Pleuronectes platessa]
VTENRSALRIKRHFQFIAPTRCSSSIQAVRLQNDIDSYGSATFGGGTAGRAFTVSSSVSLGQRQFRMQVVDFRTASRAAVGRRSLLEVLKRTRPIHLTALPPRLVGGGGKEGKGRDREASICGCHSQPDSD